MQDFPFSNPLELRLLLPHEMIFIDIELVADVLVNLPVRQQNESTLEGMGFGEGFRIFESNFDFEVTEVGTAVSLDNV